MGTRKQAPKPIMNRRLLLISALLTAFCLGLIIGVVMSGVVIFLSLVLLLVAGGLFLEAWHVWQREYRLWVSRPVRAAAPRRTREVEG